jgi:hypothetical protein
MAARVFPLIVMTRVNPNPGLGAEEKHIRILYDFLRNVVSELARSRVLVNYRKNHKMKPFAHCRGLVLVLSHPGQDDPSPNRSITTKRSRGSP